MKKNGRLAKIVGAALAAAITVSSLSTLTLQADAAGIKGDFFTDGTPPFAYVITGIKPETAGNTVKLYQNEGMQSYADYNGSYVIPETVYNSEEMQTAYTVTEIGGAIGDSIPGALEGVGLSAITLPDSVTTIGRKAFANCTNLTEIELSTAITKIGDYAFNNTNLKKLTLNVSQSAILTSDSSYTAARSGTYVVLPCDITNLNVSQSLTVTSKITIPGDTTISNAGVTVQPGASLSLDGSLSGTGVIEVKNNGELTLAGSTAAYRGSIRLTGANSEFTNASAYAVSVMNAQGQAITVPAGDTLLGSQEQAPSLIPDTPASAEPQITANYGGSVAVEEDGKVIVISVLEGYIVEDVVINGLSMGSITRYEFETATSENTVVVTFAQGNAVEGPQLPVTDPSVFTDIDDDADYAESVNFLTNNGIFLGVSSTSFAPQQKTSRAMFLSVLKRLEIYGGDFKVECEEPVYPADVEEGLWYSEAAAWAAGVGIINGHAYLQPDEVITREQAAICLYRYNRARGYAAVIDAGRYHSYRDSLMLQNESRKAMVWAASSGYLKTKNSTLDPAGTITRAELAEMLARYISLN